AELVAGFHVEYGGFKMNLFDIGEYGHMIVASALMAVFYLGGYGFPVASWTPEAVYQYMTTLTESATAASALTSIAFHLCFMAKLAMFLFIFVWVRWTLPRFRYDHLMDLGWKTMLPWALANTILTAFLIFAAHI
ncbi:MAG: NADH-quinone oxidoreductase subunit H, partial [Pseudobdellovibrionaceae bacterium]